MMKSCSLITALAIALAGCGGPSRPPRMAEAAGGVQAGIPVEAATASMREWPRVYVAPGTVRARATTVVAAKWMGYAREVDVRVGDRVRAGQRLAELDARDLDASFARASAAVTELREAIPEADSALAAAKANLDLAQVTFRRMNELYEKTSISNQEFDESSAKLEAAQAAYDMARAKRAQLDPKIAQAGQELRAAQVARGYAEIDAPAAGIVTVKSVEPGGLAVPGAPLLTIESGGYRLETDVEESKLASIRVGQPASIALDGFDHAFEARVSEIVPSVDAATRASTVKLDLPAEAALRSGMFGRATFTLGARGALGIPAAAVMTHGEIQSVMVAGNGIARTRLITVGERVGDQVEALSGLSAGEMVISPALPTLADGAKIEVRQ